MSLFTKKSKIAIIAAIAALISSQAISQVNQPSVDDLMMLYLKETGQLRIALAEAKSEAISLKKQLEEYKKSISNGK